MLQDIQELIVHITTFLKLSGFISHKLPPPFFFFFPPWVSLTLVNFNWNWNPNLTLGIRPSFAQQSAWSKFVFGFRLIVELVWLLRFCPITCSHESHPCRQMHVKTLEQALLVLRNLRGTSVQAWAEHAHVQCHICLNHLTAGQVPVQEFPSG